jgi:uncharacterized protein (TIGR02145 family)
MIEIEMKSLLGSISPNKQFIHFDDRHIPTQAEFETLEAAVNKDGNALKALGQGSGSGIGTNTSGFSALLAGYRDFGGYFTNLGDYADFWSSNEYSTYYACYLNLYFSGSNFSLNGYDKVCGFSVRCESGDDKSTNQSEEKSTAQVNNNYASVKIGDDKSTNQSEKKSTALVNNNYKTVKIGEQTWMTKNLNVDHYRNGDPIPEVKDPVKWKNLTTGAWCYYNNDPENGGRYGKLYNWYAVDDPRGLAPEGWHISTQPEFQTLLVTVNKDGNALKALGQGSGDGAGTNTSGFSALLAGYRHTNGYFYYLGYGTYFWSSTEDIPDDAYYLGLNDDDGYVGLDYIDKAAGFSVRCVKY